ncbi:MAG: hypothetical protein JW942_08270 [Opitutales bacterium]|nr:hypothetical protein [Opitutales bacterium]
MPSRPHIRGERSRGFALALVLGVLCLLLIALAGQSVQTLAARRIAHVRHEQALARANARLALGRAIATLSEGPGRDLSATAGGDTVAGTAQPCWTLCEKADASRFYLVSGQPSDSHVAATCQILPEGEGQDAVYAPLEELADADGLSQGQLAWWAEDLGVLPCTGPSDGRDALGLYSDMEIAQRKEELARLSLQIPGPPVVCDDTKHTAWNAFTLCNTLEGGLREDLSALASEEADAFAMPPPESWKQWMRSSFPLDGKMDTTSGPALFQPAVTEFVLACGLGLNNDQYRHSPSRVDLIFTYMLWVELWNPMARTIATGENEEDLLVKISGLPKVTTNTDLSIVLPDPLEVTLDCFYDMAPGQLLLLASPKEGGGTHNLGVWQDAIGSTYLNTFTRYQDVTLSFSASNPVIEFYKIGDSAGTPFHTISIGHMAAFTMSYGSSKLFCRSASVEGSRGMNRDAINAENGWGFAWHARLVDDAPDELFREWEPRRELLEIEQDGDSHNYILADPSKYARSDAIRAADFFASMYSSPPYGDRHALLSDPPVRASLSFLSLRHAPLASSNAFAIGAGLDEEADAMLDRYFFSSLPEGEWDGESALENFRIVPAGSTKPDRSPDDARELLLEGGFNINTADAKAWAAILRSFACKDWTAKSGSTTRATDLEAPFASMPWSASRPPSQAALDAIIDADLDALDSAKTPLSEKRWHPAYLVGIRDIGPYADELAEEIAKRIALRGSPFHSLKDFAQSRILQDAIDAVPAINRRSGAGDGIPRGSPANVDQSLVLSALSPILFTRSDSFRVRVVGQSAGGTKARAEAVLQRLPYAVGGDAEKNGRQFRIVQFRWLAAGE